MSQKATNNIKKIRLSRDMSLAEVARAAGTTHAQVLKLENGARRLTQDWMIRLAKPLGVAPAALISDSHSTPAVSDDAALFWHITEIMIDQARAYPTLKKAMLIGIAKAIFKSVKDGKVPLTGKNRAQNLSRAMENLIAYEAGKSVERT